MSVAPPARYVPVLRRRYRRTLGARLRILLFVVYALVALLVANSVYLVSISLLGALKAQSYENLFFLWMFGLHLVLGLLIVVPFVTFAGFHLWQARRRVNRRAVRIGYGVLVAALVVLGSGIALVRVPGFFDLREPSVTRSMVYWLHAICPLVVLWLYWLHRLAGPPIRWRPGLAYLAGVGAVVVGMVVLQSQDPRDWYQQGSQEGDFYFHPSAARTVNGKFISKRALLNEEYCMQCHQDAFAGWFHSAHRLSSFNNPAYLATINETGNALSRRDGNQKALRWCAGCHDPVPFFSGEFENPSFNVTLDRSAQAGITCTSCHAITHVNSSRGNADYVIEEPLHYPFAYSKRPLLQLLNHTLVKAKPDFHKKSMLKPFHKTAEFCSTCHKQHLPRELTQIHDFHRGQNHYDSFLSSGASGRSARSFYYPDQASTNCSDCHMPLRDSDDLGSRSYPALGRLEPSIHDHQFVGANTGVTWFKDLPAATDAQREFLQGVVRVDLFGVKEAGKIDGKLHAPLRPVVPPLTPGSAYLFETVIRTLGVGHQFTEGTSDSNQVWLEVRVTSGKRMIAHSGALDSHRHVDPEAHFINVFMLDRNGKRVVHRNTQDIFVPLYDHQIPPDAARVVHYGIRLPHDLTDSVLVEIKLNYRKFDSQYTDFIASVDEEDIKPLPDHPTGEPYLNRLPVVTMAADSVTFPIVAEGQTVTNATELAEPWERWNDYGIGLLLGGVELRQASEAFQRVHEHNRSEGLVNLARLYLQEGRNERAVEVLQRAETFVPPAPSWTREWLMGVANRRQGRLVDAEQNFRNVLERRTEQMRKRGFDFSTDFEVINLLGLTLSDQATTAYAIGERERAVRLLRSAADVFERTLTIDSEDAMAHHNLQRLFSLLGDSERAAYHGKLFRRYRADDHAWGMVAARARKRYAAANRAANPVVVYPLKSLGTQADDALDGGREPAIALPAVSAIDTRR